MEAWKEDQIRMLNCDKSEKEFFDEIISYGSNLGFEYCAYGFRLPLPFSNPKIMMLNNYPLEWQIQYTEHNYINLDPTIKLAMRTIQPIIWSEEMFSKVPDFWEAARSHGLNIGLAQSVRDNYGVVGMLTLARTCEKFSDNEFQEKRMKILWLTQVAHLGMTQHTFNRVLPENEIRLSNREIAVLRWTADGKTSGEISTILGIAERTVNFHVNNAVEKLGVTNKMAAAVKATMLGILL